MNSQTKAPDFLKMIETAKQDGGNLLFPSIPLTYDPEGIFEPVLEYLTISPNTADKEVYPGSGKDKFRLHATALRRIAACGSVKWCPEESGYFKENGGERIRFRAVGGILKADGEPYKVAGYYDMDLAVIRDDLIDHYTTKAKKERKDQKYIDYCVNRDFRHKRQHMLAMCETGAKNRVIRELFNVKSEYTKAELAKPFVVLRFKLRMNYDDPMVKRIVLQASVANALGIYGPAVHRLSQGHPQPPLIEAEFKPIDPATDPNIPADEESYAPDPDELAPQEEPSLKEQFHTMDRDTKIRWLRELASKKGYNLHTLKRPLEQFQDKHLIGFFEKLEGMPDTDIPF